MIGGLETGGAERQLSLLLQSSQTTSLENVVISLGGGGYIADAITALGVRVHMLNVQRPYVGLMALPRLCRLVHSERPDVIQGWLPHGNLVASFVGSISQRCSVCWNIRRSLYDAKNDKLTTRWATRAEAAWSKFPARIIYNSRASAEQHEAEGYPVSQAVVIPNGFDCTTFRPDSAARQAVRLEHALTDEHVLVGLIARYDPMKDHANFLKAAALVHEHFPQARFLLAGNNVTLANPVLSRLVREPQLSGCTYLLGEGQDMARLYPSLDIVVSSSWTEAFPNVVGEAMACGVPCVATAVGDTRSLVGETGTIVPPRNHVALASAILDLCRAGPGARAARGCSARQHIEQHYSLEMMARRYEDLYYSLGRTECAA